MVHWVAFIGQMLADGMMCSVLSTPAVVRSVGNVNIVGVLVEFIAKARFKELRSW